MLVASHLVFFKKQYYTKRQYCSKNMIENMIGGIISQDTLMVSPVEFAAASIGIATLLLALVDILTTRRHRSFYKFDMEKLPLPALVRHNGQTPVSITSQIKATNTKTNIKHQHFE